MSNFSKTIEFTNMENVFHKGFNFGNVGYHEYETKAYLIPGTYELHYYFSSTETEREFYVRVLDPDGSEIKYVYGNTPEESNGQFTFETQKTGEHTFQFGGKWLTFDAFLYKLIKGEKIVYPYELALYFGLLLLLVGAIMSISAALVREKKDKVSDS